MLARWLHAVSPRTANPGFDRSDLVSTGKLRLNLEGNSTVTTQHPALQGSGPPHDTPELTEDRRQEALLTAEALQRAIFNSANFSSIATEWALCRHGLARVR